MRKVFSLLIILIAGFGGIYFIGSNLEKIKPQKDENFSDEDLYLSARNLSLIGSDFRGLLADWYWIQSLQYMGDKVLNYQGDVNVNNLRPLNPRLLYPMLDTATTLDPHFITAYSYGAAILPAINNEQAVKLLEKGISENPENWRLYHNLGFIYWQSKDYSKASALYEEGSKKEGAPVWMRQMSASMQARGGTREFARQIYKQMYETAEDVQTKSFAELRFAQIQSLDELDTINSGLQIFQKRNNRCPQNWREIMPYLEKTVPPYGDALQRNEKSEMLDPTGVPYVLENQTGECKVNLSDDSKIPRF